MLSQNGDILYRIEGMKRCPLDNTSKIIGKKFTLLILRNMMSNQTKFNQFIESIEGLNPKTLSMRLKEMEKNGLIYRKIYNETPIRIEYYLQKRVKHLNLYLTRWRDFLLSIVLKIYSRTENLEPYCKQVRTNIGMRMFTKLEYTEKAFRESMRLYPQAWTIGRQTLNDYNVGKYVVPACSIIFCAKNQLLHAL